MGGFNFKNLPWEGYGSFLEQHILKVCSCSVHASWELKLSFSELLSQIFSSKFREFCAVGEYIEAFEDTFEGSR